MPPLLRSTRSGRRHRCRKACADRAPAGIGERL